MRRDDFEAYEDISPGLAGRIRAMLSDEEQHQRRIERRRLLLHSKLELVGLVFLAAVFIAASLLAFADYLTLVGQGDFLRFFLRPLSSSQSLLEYC